MKFEQPSNYRKAVNEAGRAYLEALSEAGTGISDEKLARKLETAKEYYDELIALGPPFCAEREHLKEERENANLARIQAISIGLLLPREIESLDEAERKLKAHVDEHGCV